MGTIARLFQERCPLCKSRLALKGQCPHCCVTVIRHPAAFSTTRCKLTFFVGAVIVGWVISAALDALGIQQLSVGRIVADGFVALGYFLIFRWGYRYFQEISLTPTGKLAKPMAPTKTRQWVN